MSEDKIIYEYGSYSSLVGNSSFNIFGTNLSEIFSPDAVRGIIKDPMSNNKVLRDLSRIVYNANGIVANTIDKMVSLPTLDKVVVPYGESKQKKGRTKRSPIGTRKLTRQGIGEGLYTRSVGGRHIFLLCRS